MTTVIQWNPAYDTAVSQFREPELTPKCLMPWRFMFIQEHTKKVIGCPYHTIPYGDLEQMSLEQVWNSAPIQQMRRSLLDGEIPRFCLNHSASCPVIHDARTAGHAPPAEAEIVVGENDYWFMAAGWYGMEPAGEPMRWMGREASLRLRTSEARGVRIELLTLKPELARQPLTGSVWVGEERLGGFEIPEPEWRGLIFPLPKQRRGEETTLRIVVDETWSPSEGGSGDTRKLGVAVRRVLAI